MRTLDNKTARTLILSAATAVLLTAFANCGTYSDEGTTVNSSLLDVTCDDDCIVPAPENLAVKVNLGEGTDFPVNPVSDFNLGGDCNEGGFPYNTIVWELWLNGQKVRDSNMAGTAGTGNANSSCKNGRFMLYVYLGPVAAGDNVDRSGLKTSTGAVAPYNLYVEIYGQTVPYGPAQRNSVSGRRSYSLNPVTSATGIY